jgi:hypothetical protein
VMKGRIYLFVAFNHWSHAVEFFFQANEIESGESRVFLIVAI